MTTDDNVPNFCYCCFHGNEEDNPVLICTCGVRFHLGCCGRRKGADENLKFCKVCYAHADIKTTSCELCPAKGGLFTRTKTNRWVHIVCSLYIPETLFEDLQTMEPVDLSRINNERLKQRCYVCLYNNRQKSADHGACITCQESGCNLNFHVTCAHANGLLLEIDYKFGDDKKIKYTGYCGTHIQQKNTKQKDPFHPNIYTFPDNGFIMNDFYMHSSDSSNIAQSSIKVDSNGSVEQDVANAVVVRSGTTTGKRKYTKRFSSRMKNPKDYNFRHRRKPSSSSVMLNNNHSDEFQVVNGSSLTEDLCETESHSNKPNSEFINGVSIQQSGDIEDRSVVDANNSGLSLINCSSANLIPNGFIQEGLAGNSASSVNDTISCDGIEETFMDCVVCNDVTFEELDISDHRTVVCQFPANIHIHTTNIHAAASENELKNFAADSLVSYFGSVREEYSNNNNIDEVNSSVAKAAELEIQQRACSSRQIPGPSNGTSTSEQLVRKERYYRRKLDELDKESQQEVPHNSPIIERKIQARICYHKRRISEFTAKYQQQKMDDLALKAIQDTKKGYIHRLSEYTKQSQQESMYHKKYYCRRKISELTELSKQRTSDNLSLSRKQMQDKIRYHKSSISKLMKQRQQEITRDFFRLRRKINSKRYYIKKRLSEVMKQLYSLSNYGAELSTTTNYDYDGSHTQVENNLIEDNRIVNDAAAIYESRDYGNRKRKIMDRSGSISSKRKINDCNMTVNLDNEPAITETMETYNKDNGSKYLVDVEELPVHRSLIFGTRLNDNEVHMQGLTVNEECISLEQCDNQIENNSVFGQGTSNEPIPITKLYETKTNNVHFIPNDPTICKERSYSCNNDTEDEGLQTNIQPTNTVDNELVSGPLAIKRENLIIKEFNNSKLSVSNDRTELDSIDQVQLIDIHEVFQNSNTVYFQNESYVVNRAAVDVKFSIVDKVDNRIDVPTFNNCLENISTEDYQICGEESSHCKNNDLIEKTLTTNTKELINSECTTNYEQCASQNESTKTNNTVIDIVDTTLNEADNEQLHSMEACHYEDLLNSGDAKFSVVVKVDNTIDVPTFFNNCLGNISNEDYLICGEESSHCKNNDLIEKTLTTNIKELINSECTTDFEHHASENQSTKTNNTVNEIVDTTLNEADDEQLHSLEECHYEVTINSGDTKFPIVDKDDNTIDIPTFFNNCLDNNSNEDYQICGEESSNCKNNDLIEKTLTTNIKELINSECTTNYVQHSSQNQSTKTNNTVIDIVDTTLNDADDKQLHSMEECHYEVTLNSGDAKFSIVDKDDNTIDIPTFFNNCLGNISNEDYQICGEESSPCMNNDLIEKTLTTNTKELINSECTTNYEQYASENQSTKTNNTVIEIIDTTSNEADNEQLHSMEECHYEVLLKSGDPKFSIVDKVDNIIDVPTLFNNCLDNNSNENYQICLEESSHCKNIELIEKTLTTNTEELINSDCTMNYEQRASENQSNNTNNTVIDIVDTTSNEQLPSMEECHHEVILNSGDAKFTIVDKVEDTIDVPTFFNNCLSNISNDDYLICGEESNHCKNNELIKKTLSTNTEELINSECTTNYEQCASQNESTKTNNTVIDIVDTTSNEQLPSMEECHHEVILNSGDAKFTIADKVEDTIDVPTFFNNCLENISNDDYLICGEESNHCKNNDLIEKTLSTNTEELINSACTTNYEQCASQNESTKTNSTVIDIVDTTLNEADNEQLHSMEECHYVDLLNSGDAKFSVVDKVDNTIDVPAVFNNCLGNISKEDYQICGEESSHCKNNDLIEKTLTANTKKLINSECATNYEHPTSENESTKTNNTVIKIVHTTSNEADDEQLHSLEECHYEVTINSGDTKFSIVDKIDNTIDTPTFFNNCLDNNSNEDYQICGEESSHCKNNDLIEKTLTTNTKELINSECTTNYEQCASQNESTKTNNTVIDIVDTTLNEADNEQLHSMEACHYEDLLNSGDAKFSVVVKVDNTIDVPTFFNNCLGNISNEDYLICGEESSHCKNNDLIEKTLTTNIKELINSECTTDFEHHASENQSTKTNNTVIDIVDTTLNEADDEQLHSMEECHYEVLLNSGNAKFSIVDKDDNAIDIPTFFNNCLGNISNEDYQICEEESSPCKNNDLIEKTLTTNTKELINSECTANYEHCTSKNESTKTNNTVIEIIDTTLNENDNEQLHSMEECHYEVLLNSDDAKFSIVDKVDNTIDVPIVFNNCLENYSNEDYQICGEESSHCKNNDLIEKTLTTNTKKVINSECTTNYEHRTSKNESTKTNNTVIEIIDTTLNENDNEQLHSMEECHYEVLFNSGDAKFSIVDKVDNTIDVPIVFNNCLGNISNEDYQICGEESSPCKNNDLIEKTLTTNTKKLINFECATNYEHPTSENESTKTNNTVIDIVDTASNEADGVQLFGLEECQNSAHIKEVQHKNTFLDQSSSSLVTNAADKFLFNPKVGNSIDVSAFLISSVKDISIEGSGNCKKELGYYNSIDLIEKLATNTKHFNDFENIACDDEHISDLEVAKNANLVTDVIEVDNEQIHGGEKYNHKEILNVGDSEQSVCIQEVQIKYTVPDQREAAENNELVSGIEFSFDPELDNSTNISTCFLKYQNNINEDDRICEQFKTSFKAPVTNIEKVSTFENVMYREDYICSAQSLKNEKSVNGAKNITDNIDNLQLHCTNKLSDKEKFVINDEQLLDAQEVFQSKNKFPIEREFSVIDQSIGDAEFSFVDKVGGTSDGFTYSNNSLENISSEQNSICEGKSGYDNNNNNDDLIGGLSTTNPHELDNFEDATYYGEHASAVQSTESENSITGAMELTNVQLNSMEEYGHKDMLNINDDDDETFGDVQEIVQNGNTVINQCAPQVNDESSPDVNMSFIPKADNLSAASTSSVSGLQNQEDAVDSRGKVEIGDELIRYLNKAWKYNPAMFREMASLHDFDVLASIAEKTKEFHDRVARKYGDNTNGSNVTTLPGGPAMRDILCVDDDDLSDISMTSLSSISSCSTTTTTFTITDTSQVVVASPPFQVPSCDDENVVTPKDNSMSSISIPSSGSLSKDQFEDCAGTNSDSVLPSVERNTGD